MLVHLRLYSCKIILHMKERKVLRVVLEYGNPLIRNYDVFSAYLSWDSNFVVKTPHFLETCT